MYWPTVVSWGDEQETKEIVTLGWRLLQKAIERQEDWVNGEGLEYLFNENDLKERIALEQGTVVT